MNMKAIAAVLEALSGKAQDDMADKISSPEEKLEDAIQSAEGKPGMSEDDEDEDFEADAPDEMESDEDDPEAPLRNKLKEFMKPKFSATKKPGTAVMIAVDKKVPVGKKSIKDLMHG